MPNQSQASFTELNLMTPDFEKKCNFTNIAKVVKSVLILTTSDSNWLGNRNLSILICPRILDSVIPVKIMHPCVRLSCDGNLMTFDSKKQLQNDDLLTYQLRRGVYLFFNFVLQSFFFLNHTIASQRYFLFYKSDMCFIDIFIYNFF